MSILKLGTRGSPLALAQAREVEVALQRGNPALAEAGAIETVIIRTTGDKIQNRALADEGGKALFAKEIEEALIERRIDIGVHSAKDLPTILPAGLAIGAVLKRADARDAFFARGNYTLETLPPGSVIGTASPRRQALVLAARSDLRVTLMRGNVDTRLKKLVAGEVDATLLAVAGLERLGEAHRIRVYLDPNTIVPAAGQGAIALEMRIADQATAAWVQPINHAESFSILAAERAVVHALEGSCTSPIAAWGREHSGEFVIDALAARLDGSAIHRLRLTGAMADMVSVGHEAGRQLKGALPAGFFA